MNNKRGTPKKDGSGQGRRANQGRGGCKNQQDKKTNTQPGRGKGGKRNQS